MCIRDRCGNMASYFSSDSDKIWQYDFEKLTFAAAMIYGYVSVVPLLLHCALRMFGEGLPLSYLLCLYGYMMFVFIPAAVICTVPIELLRWAAVAAACVSSGGVLVGNLAPIVISSLPARGSLTCVVLGAIHLAICFAFKVYFFEFPS
eukprot:TRINITY_DN4974_c0_g1_i7.p1 TRINITY_DN4974_c0_g1~~TRINITY_DN4974_c0_g1_i7.p1  ORF type:complete len:148 (+),score=16.87 TRINITY_DN4974_c0_g1_i7:190-633(+)